MLSPSFGAISTEKILRNDVFQPVSLGIEREKLEKSIDKTEISSIINDNLKILHSIKVPNHFNQEILASFLEKMIKKEIEKDLLHKQAVELNKYANDFRTYMHQYFDKIFKYHEQLKEDLVRQVFVTSNEYIKSDLPASFARTLTLSLFTECKFVDIYNAKIRRERLSLITYYNDHQKFKRVVDNHNAWVDPLDSMLTNIDETRIGILWYVDFSNSQTIEEIFKPKILKKSLLDEEYFFEALIDLQRNTDQMRKALASLSRETFAVSPSRDDSTVDMLCSVMEILGS